MKMIGTIAISSNSSIESAALPTGELVPEIGSTIAVDDSASARPSAIAPVQYWPIIASTSAMEVPMIVSSSAPSPKTSLRICHNRLNDSSSPMVNRSRMIPNSAKIARESGSDIVTAVSHLISGVSAPSPYGPTRMPISRKPITGVIRKRANSGMTIPAAPKITSASDSAVVG